MYASERKPSCGAEPLDRASHWQGLTRSDMRLIRQAISRRWPTPPDHVCRDILAALVKRLDDERAPRAHVLAAARTVIAVDLRGQEP